MRVIIFTDLENFKESLWKIDPSRQVDIKHFHHNLFEYVITKLNLKKYNPHFIRAYIYTGEYTDSLISKIKFELDKKLVGSDEHSKINNFLTKIKKRQENQQKMMDFSTFCNFLEIKTTPLHYTPNEAINERGIFQKGIDVQLAVDLLHHAYEDNFDVAIVCSGDIDLLGSVELAKMKGKKIVLVSHSDMVSKNMIKGCDYFFMLEKLTSMELDGLSNKLIKKPYPAT